MGAPIGKAHDGSTVHETRRRSSRRATRPEARAVIAAPVPAGVGPTRAVQLERMGLVTIEDLLRHYPRTYLDARRFVSIREIEPGALVTVSGAVRSAAATRTRSGRTDFMAAIDDGTGHARPATSSASRSSRAR